MHFNGQLLINEIFLNTNYYFYKFIRYIIDICKLKKKNKMIKKKPKSIKLEIIQYYYYY